MSFGGGGGGGGQIATSSDVALSSPANGQVLAYNTTLQKWQNATPAAAAVSSVAGRTGDVVLSAGDVGLSNIDNTSDANKPVSTAQATAIALKATDTAVVHLSGTETITGTKTFSSAPIVPDASFAIAKTTGLQTALDAKQSNLGYTAENQANKSTVTTLGASDTVYPTQNAVKTYVDTATSTKEPVVTSGTTAQYYRGDKSWQTLDKTAVGLSNVDNTSDAGKPVSTAQATAIALKATDTAVVHVTGTETVAGVKTFSSAPVVPDASFAIAKTTGLQTALDAKADTASLGAKVIVLGPTDPVPGGTPAGTVIVRTS